MKRFDYANRIALTIDKYTAISAAYGPRMTNRHIPRDPYSETIYL